jgi:hypothetical protein
MKFVAKYRSFLLLVAVVLAGAIALAVAAQEVAPTSPAAREARINEALPAAGELKDMALKYDVRIAGLEQQLKDTRQGIQSLHQALSTLATLVEESRKPPSSEPAPAPPVPIPGRILSVDLSPPPGENPSLRVPAGSFGEATLLTGVFAPVTGEPLPVLIRLDAVLTGPNRSRIPIQNAMLLGKAVGDANTARAVIQLTTLSLVLNDGTTREKSMNGYVVDADGIQGLQGEYMWNAKSLIGLSVLSGGTTGAANAFGQSQTSSLIGPGGMTREVTKDVGVFVGSSATSRALDNINRIIEERMREFIPAIYVSNRNRRVTVVLLQGVSLEGVRLEGSRRHLNLGGFDK